MTNSEARSILIKTKVMCVSGKITDWEKAQELAYVALQENDKLKADIEQLKENINKISVFENELYSEKQVAVDCEDAYMELAIDNQLNAVSRIKLMMKH